MTSPPRIPLIALVAVLLLTLVLVPVFSGVAREAVAVPLWYAIWLIRLILYSVHQSLTWAVLLTVVVYVAIRSLLRPPEPLRPPDAVVRHRGQVRILNRWIQDRGRRLYVKWRLAQRLSKLALEVLAYTHHLTPGQVRATLQEIDASPEIRSYLKAGLTMILPPRPDGLDRLLHRLRLQTSDSPLDLDPELVVRFLEGQLDAS